MKKKRNVVDKNLDYKVKNIFIFKVICKYINWFCLLFKDK